MNLSETRRLREPWPAVAAILLLTFGVATATASAGQAKAGPEGKTLYERLGGYEGVVSYIALVFPRVAQHPELSHLFRGHGKDSQEKQFQLVVELICRETGGPCAYVGREMPRVHRGLGITAHHWDVFLEIIERGLIEKGYPEDTREDFLRIWRGFRDGVVDTPDECG